MLTFSDPWSFKPMYAVACGGGGGAYIAAHSVHHSIMAFWDMHSTTHSWSIHAPSNNHSPVYSIILESSHLFGATKSRPFVYDFGPSIRPEEEVVDEGGFFMLCEKMRDKVELEETTMLDHDGGDEEF